MQTNTNGNGNGVAKSHISFFSRLFNIMPPQWPRVTECWLFTFFFKLGSAIGWTILTAGFVARFGILSLPVLFVINSLLIMISTYFFEHLILSVKREVLMIIMVLCAAICLFLASFLYDTAPFAFFSLVIVAESIFLAQFNVFIPILVGDRFTPLESQKTFPFIESAETIGGIIGGTFIGFFGAELPVSWFLYVWIILLACIIFVFIITSVIRPSLPPLLFAAANKKAETMADQLHVVLESIKKVPFFRGLIIIVLFQWVFMNILELQFTKSLEQSITHRPEQTIANILPQALQAAVLHSTEGVDDPVVTRAPFPRVLSVEEQALLTEKLGKYKGIFYAGALIVQMLLASRLITALGIVGSLLLNPILMLMSLVGMFLKFNFTSSMIARMNFETTNVIHKNAYFSSHYALPKEIRDQAAEFLEGIVRPIGTVVGMLFILVLQMVFSGRDLSMWIHLIMFVIMGIVLVRTIWLQSEYTDVTKEQLFSDLPYPEKLNAIEILAQRGHSASPQIIVRKLQSLLKNGESESPEVRIKLVSALGHFADFETIPDIVEALYDPHPDVRLEAANALLNFRDIGTQFYSQAFSRYRVVEALKDIFRHETSAAVRSSVMRVFSLLRQPDIVPYLLGILQSETSEAKADCLYTLGLFRDPAVAYYIAPFLNNDDLKIRANAIVALWHFHSYRPLLKSVLHDFLNGEHHTVQAAGLYAAGETGFPDSRLLRHKLNHDNDEIKHEAAFALAKRGDRHGAAALIEHLLAMPLPAFENARRFCNRLCPSAQKVFEQMVVNALAEELSRLTGQYQGKLLNEIDQSDLERLRRLYALLGRHEELFSIEAALKAEPKLG